MLTGAFQFGQGLGGFKANFIHSLGFLRPWLGLPHRTARSSSSPSADLPPLHKRLYKNRNLPSGDPGPWAGRETVKQPGQLACASGAQSTPRKGTVGVRHECKGQKPPSLDVTRSADLPSLSKSIRRVCRLYKCFGPLSLRFVSQVALDQSRQPLNAQSSSPRRATQGVHVGLRGLPACSRGSASFAVTVTTCTPHIHISLPCQAPHGIQHHTKPHALPALYLCFFLADLVAI